MSFTTAYPRVQSALFKFLNMEMSGDQTAEDAALYSWLDQVFEVCFAEAGSYCGQPLQASSVNYVFSYSEARKGLENNHRWKYIPFNANTSLTGLQWRENEFSSFAAVNVQKYLFTTDNGINYLVFRDITEGQFKATLSTGWSDANLPTAVIQGIVEMTAWIYKNSATGGNWFGLTSISTGGAGQNVNSSLLTKLEWQKYFSKYRIPAV
ncbi:MAG: hypothetical protein ACKODS_06010 [Methylophilaceae bacterium]